jgi:transposase
VCIPGTPGRSEDPAVRDGVEAVIPGTDEAVLREWVAGGGPAAARRASIVLLSAQGLSTVEVAAEVGCAKQTVVTWRERYRVGGLAALGDAPRSGRPVTVDEGALLLRTLGGPPARQARWSTRTLAAELGVSNGTVAGVWRSWGIRPTDGGLRFTTRPPLDLRAGAVCALVVTGSLRALAVRPAEPSAGRDRPGAAPPDLVGRLERTCTRATGRGAAPAVDLAVAAARGGVLVVDDGCTADLPAGLRVHVTPVGRWARAVHLVVALLDGGAPAPVATDLADALDRHLDGAGDSFAWVRPGQPNRISCKKS